MEDERDPATGRRRQIKLRAKTKAAALAKANEHRKRLDAGIREQPRLTVEQFLTEWLAVILPARVGPATVDNYGAAINGRLIPGLGHYKMRDLTPEHVDRLLKAKADAGLSRAYLGRMRTILTDLLNHAERRQLVGRNASRLSIVPACEPTPEERSLTAKEADAFVAEAMSADKDGAVKHRLAAMFILMITLGLRPGEATGLLCEDLDTEAGTLAITGSIKRVPKARSCPRLDRISRTRVHLAIIHPPLRAHRPPLPHHHHQHGHPDPHRRRAQKILDRSTPHREVDMKGDQEWKVVDYPAWGSNRSTASSPSTRSFGKGRPPRG